jgi:hypothetical protein
MWSIRVGSDNSGKRGVQGDAALSRLVTELYPQCRLKLSIADDKLIVEGQARDRQEAVQILSLIRSVRPIPVVDRLTVKGR